MFAGPPKNVSNALNIIHVMGPSHHQYVSCLIDAMVSILFPPKMKNCPNLDLLLVISITVLPLLHLMTEHQNVAMPDPHVALIRVCFCLCVVDFASHLT